MDQQSPSVIQSIGPQLLRTKERNQNEAESSRVSGPAKVRTQLSLCTAPQGRNTTYLLINTSLLEMTVLHEAQQ